jgi:hypothetical protein
MPNTTNYSFPTPADTDLVKNGADAIRDLGDAVDTAMNTALGTKKAGMVLLNTTSFSGVASQSINDVFSATYDNYKVVVSSGVSTSADRVISMRLRVGGADDSGTAYRLMSTGINASGTGVNSTSTSATSFVLQTNAYYNDALFSATFDVINPFAATDTNISGQSVGGNNTVNFGLNINGSFISETSFTGFSLLNSSGNFSSGKVSVYGYNK